MGKLQEGKVINQFRIRDNIPIVVMKFNFDNYHFVKVINQNITEENTCIYIHGGPNIDFMQYINDTINKVNRSIENILMVSNVLFVDQYYDISLSNYNLSEINKIGDPRHLSSRYIGIINNFLTDECYGIFAQSFGMSILGFICQNINNLKYHPKYMFISSPFLYTTEQSLFIYTRRKRILDINYKLKDFLFNNKNIISISHRLDDANEHKIKINKISQEIVNPFVPIGLIYEKLKSKIQYLYTCNDSDFISYFSNPQINVVNYIIGSKYFSPKSNIYLETKSSIENIEYKKWMLDEGKYLCHLYEYQYKNTEFLEYTSKKYRNLKNWHIYITECAKSIKTQIIFNVDDISIPVDFYINEFTPLLEDSLKIDVREGYGHWVGHNTFIEFYKEIQCV